MTISRKKSRCAPLRHLRRLGLASLAALALQLLAVAGAEAYDRRVAFVVGNSAYHNVPSLPNPANDAREVASALRRAGFEVITANDLDRTAFDVELREFVRSLAGAEVSLFYYSGHGVQIGGDNRIIPVDAALKTAMDMEVETVSVRTILGYMQAQSRLQVIFLDSCRNNPFPARAYFIGAGLEQTQKDSGLAAVEASQGSLIAYSTQPGNVAVDGSGNLSPFTAAFLQNGFRVGVDLQSALMKVTQEVWQETAHRQRPWTSYTLVEPLYLARPAVMATADDTQKVEQPASTNTQSQTEISQPPAVNLAQGIADYLGESFAKPQRIPIGVGAVAMLDGMPIMRGDSGVQVNLAQAPSQGVLYLDGAALTEGSTVAATRLREVAYEPSLGSQGTEIAIGWSVKEADTAAISVAGKIEPYIVDCDSEAGEPLDLQGVGTGKLPNEINPDTAVPACSKAIQDFPNIARYKYQLGRAKLAAKQTADAISLIEQAADAGHTRALFELGYLAQRGLGRGQDLAEAERLFKQSAELGDPYGMLAHGRNLVLGRGTPADPEAGVKFLNRAVEMGHTYAMNELGAMYYYGRVVKKNPQRGVRFYEAALERGDIYAMNNLGLAYLEGQGVKRDPATALALFKRASEGGHPSAPNNIGRMYFSGQGVKKKLDEAMKWYRTGAERGDTWAASNLGWIFLNGPKQVRDADLAALYYGLAVALDSYGDNSEASSTLKSLPQKAKAQAIKHLVTELGNDAIETGADLDSTLVLLERKAWQKRNPRLDLF